MKKSPSGSRSFSTSSVRRSLDQFQHQQPQGQQPGSEKPSDEVSAAMVANMIAQVDHGAAEKLTGLKFPMPEELPKTENFRTRYEPLLEQFTKLLMEDGKLSRAQKVFLPLFSQLTQLIKGDANSTEYELHPRPTSHLVPSPTKPQTSSPSWPSRSSASSQPRSLSYSHRGLRCPVDQDPQPEGYCRWWCRRANPGSSL